MGILKISKDILYSIKVERGDEREESVFKEAYVKDEKELNSIIHQNIVINKSNKLRATYHVGEDFLDCADGLRAIDEAIYYLDLTHGDRLGHAIVLGIDIFEWYRKKNNKVHLTKHDILDNIAWLIMKLREYNIEGTSETVEKLISLYNKYYTEIYVAMDSEDYATNSTVIPVDNYMEAWKLRGDNPEVYMNGDIESYGMRYWDRCDRREREKLEISKTVIELYRRYHYDNRVKHIGYKKEVFKVEMYMINAINQVQKCMQDELSMKGIAIECNPSSNVLISNFARYDKHPIINMYNLGLTIDEDKAAQHTQMFVSINTDDQGVFDTLIENEFALMGIALEKAKDENGKPLYNQAMIYDWLDRIRKMGIEQSFKFIN